MRIGGEFKSSQWPSLRDRLEAGDEAAWKEAVMVLADRLRGRYLSQGRQLLDRPYSGFAVLAIDSAVIEALEQFRRGVPKTPSRKSGEFFKTFLTTTRLKRFFSSSTADLFYTTIRCGILHQAETSADSRVKKRGGFVVKRSATGEGLVINAKRLHEELEAAFEDYLDQLLGGDSRLRAAFIKKMNFIAKVPEPPVGVF